jgi:hypothetical protein
MANYRLRDFDFEFDAGEFLEYESPRPSPYMPRPVRKESYVLIDGFEPRSSVTPSQNTNKPPKQYANILRRVAHLLVASQQINMPMSDVALMGYPDAPGTDQDTINLAFNRAAGVRSRLQSLMDGISPGSSRKVTFNIFVNTAREAGRTKSVDVLLPATCQTFFADLDQQSFDHDVIGMYANPAISKKLCEERTDNLFWVFQELNWRLDKRAELALALKSMPLQPTPVSPGGVGVTRKGMIDLSDMQVKLFKKYYPDARGFAPDSLMSCMLKFANGQLRSPHSEWEKPPNEGRKNFGVGEPDGNHVFMFAEFSLLCIDWKLPDAGLWERALPAMVAAQEVFIHVYRKNPKPRDPEFDSALPNNPVAKPTHLLTDFAAANFVQTGSQTTGQGQSSEDRLTRIASKYRGMTTDQLRDQMKWNLLRAQTLT